MNKPVAGPEHAEPGLIARHRLVAASPGLEQRVLDHARETWERAGAGAEDVPWPLPVFRLAASVAVALGLVSFTTAASRQLTVRWRPVDRAEAVASQHYAPLDGVARPSFAAAAVRLPPRCTPQDLARRSHLIRELLSASRATSRGNGNVPGG